MAADMKLRELSLLQQYGAKLSQGFLVKMTTEVYDLCRKLDAQIEHSHEEEARLGNEAQRAIEEIYSDARAIRNIRDRYNFGQQDEAVFDLDIGKRERNAEMISTKLEQFKNNHQRLRTDLEDTKNRLKAFAAALTTQIAAASSSLNKQIAVLEAYKNNNV